MLPFKFDIKIHLLNSSSLSHLADMFILIKRSQHDNDKPENDGFCSLRDLERRDLQHHKEYLSYESNRQTMHLGITTWKTCDFPQLFAFKLNFFVLNEKWPPDGASCFWLLCLIQTFLHWGKLSYGIMHETSSGISRKRYLFTKYIRSCWLLLVIEIKSFK